MSAPHHVLDVTSVVVVVGLAIVFLMTRFVGSKGASSSGTVVVGAGLQKGLDKARRRRRQRR